MYSSVKWFSGVWTPTILSLLLLPFGERVEKHRDHQRRHEKAGVLMMHLTYLIGAKQTWLGQSEGRSVSCTTETSHSHKRSAACAAEEMSSGKIICPIRAGNCQEHHNLNQSRFFRTWFDLISIQFWSLSAYISICIGLEQPHPEMHLTI